MKCNYISTKAMSAEGACQKAVSLPWSCCAARCRIHWFSEDQEVSHFAQFSTSGWSHTCRHQHSQSAKVAAHKIRVELPSTRATYIIRLENSTGRMRAAISTADYSRPAAATWKAGLHKYEQTKEEFCHSWIPVEQIWSFAVPFQWQWFCYLLPPAPLVSDQKWKPKLS